jgi:hypothetical protein
MPGLLLPAHPQLATEKSSHKQRLLQRLLSQGVTWNPTDEVLGV